DARGRAWTKVTSAMAPSFGLSGGTSPSSAPRDASSCLLKEGPRSQAPRLALSASTREPQRRRGGRGRGSSRGVSARAMAADLPRGAEEGPVFCEKMPGSVARRSVARRSVARRSVARRSVDRRRALGGGLASADHPLVAAVVLVAPHVDEPGALQERHHGVGLPGADLHREGAARGEPREAPLGDRGEERQAVLAAVE